MQVNSCVNAGYYMRYQMMKTVEYDFGIGKEGTKNMSVEETTDESKTPKDFDFQKFYQEIYEKLKHGDTEPSYQIGAKAYTKKEWEEFLEAFDSMEDAIRALMREENQESVEGASKDGIETKSETISVTLREKVVIKETSLLLITPSTTCSYPTSDSDNDVRYITWYTKEGIFCRKSGEVENEEWVIAFDENEEQYEKVMDFINQFPADWNLRFAAHENFWIDFLNDDIDMEGFMEFMKGTNKGVPDFSKTIGDSMFIDTEKAQWAKYTNPLGSRMYSAQEMHSIV